MKKITVICTVPVLLAFAAGAQSQRRDVDLKAADGTLLKGTYFPAAKPGPGVMLLHMCNSQRKVWDNLAGLLNARGIHVMTVDYRGFGESGGDRFAEASPNARQSMTQQWPDDLDRVFNYFVAQPGVDSARIGVAGGSCGVNNAVTVARRHSEVKTLVLLAGGITPPSEEFLARVPWMPVMTVAAQDDGNAVDTMRWVIGFSGGTANRTKEYPNGGHGTDLFPVHKELEPEIAAWFEQHLITKPVVAATSRNPQKGPSALLVESFDQPGGAAKMLAKWREARAAGKTFPIPAEGVINARGYEYLQDGRAADAVSLFELNVEAHPNSVNAYDSLSDGYLAAGDRAKALEFARKTLELLERDTQTPADFKRQIRESAEGKIRQLSNKP